jgi:phosphoserine aminotransferase
MNFYPGPGKLDDAIAAGIQDALASGILEQNHRSPAFEALHDSCSSLIRDKWNLSPDWLCLWPGSATECWEIIFQSFDLPVCHLISGAFGEKWLQYHQASQASGIIALVKGNNDALSFPELKQWQGLICLVYCETASGRGWQEEELKALRLQNPEAIIAVDATSVMGACTLAWDLADIWFASVQKGLGLPSGLALLLVNQNRMNQASMQHQHYNDLSAWMLQSKQNQTIHTPNILGIQLMKAVQTARPSLIEVDQETKEKARLWNTFAQKFDLNHLVVNPAFRCPTVMAFNAGESLLPKIHAHLSAAGIICGKGYGPYKKSSFRMANFPQHTKEDIFIAQDSLSTILSKE